MSGIASPSLCPCCVFLPPAIFLPSDGEGLSPSLVARGAQEEESNDYSIPNPREALKLIASATTNIDEREDRPRKVLLVDTHGHPHLSRERHPAYLSPDSAAASTTTPVVSLSCAVSQSDWNQCLGYASTSEAILPALGVHPWYLADLTPSYLKELEDLLRRHPRALVGEIGLCKMAKFVRTYPDGKAAGFALQRKVFRDQFTLAAKLRRPVTVHCVKQHGVLMGVLKELKEEGKLEAKERIKQGDDVNVDDWILGKFPPAIGMHSFTGTAHHVRELLLFEEALFSSNPEEAQRPPMFYFGFSHAVNVLMTTSDKSKHQLWEAIRSVPTDRLMVESDVHASDDVDVGTAGAVGNVATALGRPVAEVAEVTSANGLRFLEMVELS